MEQEEQGKERSTRSNLRAGIREFLLIPENKVLLFEIDYHLHTCNLDWPSFAILFSHHTGSVVQDTTTLEHIPTPGDHFTSAVASMKLFIEKFAEWRLQHADEAAADDQQPAVPYSIWDDVDDTIIYAGAELKSGQAS
jgi:hypothetical protein